MKQKPQNSREQNRTEKYKRCQFTRAVVTKYKTQVALHNINHCLIVLEVRSLKLSCHRPCSLKLVRKGSSLASSSFWWPQGLLGLQEDHLDFCLALQSVSSLYVFPFTPFYKDPKSVVVPLLVPRNAMTNHHKSGDLKQQKLTLTVQESVGLAVLRSSRAVMGKPSLPLSSNSQNPGFRVLPTVSFSFLLSSSYGFSLCLCMSSPLHTRTMHLDSILIQYDLFMKQDPVSK